MRKQSFGVRRLGVLLALISLAVGIGQAGAQGGQEPGALVRTTLRSRVGVLLDEIPSSMRSRVVTALIAKPDDFWKGRAAQQLRLTTYRLVFREAFYSTPKQ